MDIPLSFSIPAIILLAIISAFFSATETSFLAVSRPRLQTLIKQGDRRAKRVQALLRNIEQIIGAILVCNNLINTLIATLTTAVFIQLFGEHGVVYASAVISIVIIVYVEVMPKLIAINNPLPVAMFLSRFIQIVAKLSRPVSQAVEQLAKTTLRLLGVSVASNTHFTNSIDELRGAIDLHQDTQHAGARAMLHSILDLNEVDVDEIMVHRQNVMMIDASLTMPQILQQIVKSPYTRMPVWQGNPDNIIGVVHAKNFLRAIQKKRQDIFKMNIADIASKPWFIPAATTLYEQLNAFREKKEHFAIVVDEYGSFLGIVTLEDIVEEIVGDINDELDVPPHGVWVGDKGEVYAVGTTTIRDLNRQFNWNLLDENAATIAGLILHEVRNIPKVGQQFAIQGFTMTILRRVKNQITLVQITLPESQPLLKENNEVTENTEWKNSSIAN
jgi:Mg2+/Co2+ transporter CorB